MAATEKAELHDPILSRLEKALRMIDETLADLRGADRRVSNRLKEDEYHDGDR